MQSPLPLRKKVWRESLPAQATRPVKPVKRLYYSFKIFSQFWLAKSTRIIHHNQLLMTTFGRILCLTRKHLDLILNYNLGLTSVWTQVLYQNKNIIPLTEAQNWSNEENILLFHSVKELNALNLEPTTSFSFMKTTLTNNDASNYTVDNFKVKKLFWFLKIRAFFLISL